MKLITLIKYDLKNYFDSKISFIVMMILPILAIIVAAQISTSLFTNDHPIDPITLVIADNEQSFYTKLFLDTIIDTPSLEENIEIIQTNEDHGHQLLDENKVAGLVVIPEKFTENMQNGIFHPITVIGNNKKPLQATIIKEGMESVTNLMSAAQSAVFTVYDYASQEPISPEELNSIFEKASLSFSLKALGRDQIFSHTIKTPWRDMNPAHFYFVSILILFISLYGLQGMYLYIRERENKLTTRIRVSGVPLWEIVLAKWISLTVFLFIQGTIILFVCKMIKLFEISGSLRQAMIFLLIVCSCISSLTLLISSLSKNDYIGSMAIFIVSILGAVLGGGIVPYSYMPQAAQQIGKFTMNHWATQGFIYSLFASETSIVWQSTIVISILTLVFLLGAFARLLWEEKKI